MAFMDTVKEEWYQALKPLEEMNREEENQLQELLQMYESSPAIVRHARKAEIDELRSIFEENKEILAGYRSRIDNATEEDLVSDDMEIMVEEIKRLRGFWLKNREYYKSQEREFM